MIASYNLYYIPRAEYFVFSRSAIRMRFSPLCWRSLQVRISINFLCLNGLGVVGVNLCLVIVFVSVVTDP